jgi:hypothetical protein
VREYVAARAGAGCLIGTYGVYERPEDIPWDTIPAPCVVKASHGSGWVRTVEDPADVDRETLAAELSQWLATDFSGVWREWHYRGLPRRLIVERRLGDGRPPLDYKFLCFAGIPRLILVGHNLLTTPMTSFYTPEWERLPMTWGRPPGPWVDPPPALDEMLELAAALARGLDFVRVDLYDDEGQPRFGELTVTPMGGFVPILPLRFDAWLGSLWTLP